MFSPGCAVCRNCAVILTVQLVLCGCCREQQRTLGDAGAVQRLVEDLKALAPAQQQQEHTGLVDTLQALLFTCCGHASNLQQSVEAGAVQQLTLGESAAAVQRSTAQHLAEVSALQQLLSNCLV